MKRAVIIVLDSVGMGELPDAEKYGDRGSNTLGNIASSVGDFSLPNLEALGLGNIDNMAGIKKSDKPCGCFGRMAEKSAGKDTTTGHWEISGVILKNPFPVYPDGFPKEVIDTFEKAINTKVIGNIAASGTEIIKMLGDQHVKTGYPIVYTSADSVFQIAAHEDVVPVEKLYEMCQKARDMLTGEHAVGRVIARPFNGTSGNYKRTERRRDFSLDPLGKTLLDYLKEKGQMVKAVGKIEDIFNRRGITDAVHTHNNMDGVDKTLDYLKDSFEGLLFTNLVDFDMLYGHRNDIKGYANAMVEFDNRLPEILNALKDDDILFITADHGCDPTTESTDHSREYVPLVVYGNKIKSNINLGTRSSFSDIAATIAEYLGIDEEIEGNSFMSQIMG
ncbi:phosphopentomutase [Acetivibrio cellulolyticus]|uniref:phosphopentomutase n=1 Tax=Acetivibrio cellulolyticus TaxID=35830 RepID=UPI0001E2E323|nr:phosphopentomutase [Acetivibrio cellulolyticus]